MKRGLKALMAIVMTVFLTTGCVKYNGNMTINADKSMEFSIIYALDTSIWGDYADMSSDDDDMQTYEDMGFKVEEYKDGDWEGIKLTKEIDNIDDVSSAEDVIYSLSDLTDDDTDTKMFKHEVVSDKDTYTAHFTFNTADSALDYDMTSDDEDDTIDVTYSDDETEEDITVTDDETEEETSSDDDMSSLLDEETMEKAVESMELKFSVTLPEEAISNNATSVDGTTYTWDLKDSYTNSEEEDIEFEFVIPEVLTTSTTKVSSKTDTKMYIGIAAVVVIIVAVVLVLVFSKKKAKTPVVNNIAVGTTPVEPNATINQTVGYGMPSAPVAPAEPVQPVIPETTPVTPVAPVIPEVQAEPVSTPVQPVAPAPVPSEPVAVSAPVTPVVPEQVSTPVTPVTPVENTNPTNNGQQM